MNQPVVVVNKSGGAGAEGFLDVKSDKGNAHKIIITLSKLFTTPLATAGNPLVGSIVTLALVLLSWPLLGAAKNTLRAHERAAGG